MSPRVSSHRDNRVFIRINSLEKKAIELAAEKADLSISEYGRRCLLGQEIKSWIVKEELELYRLLIEYRNNFSRIGNLVKERADFGEELKQVIGNIDAHLKKFNV